MWTVVLRRPCDGPSVSCNFSVLFFSDGGVKVSVLCCVCFERRRRRKNHQSNMLFIHIHLRLSAVWRRMILSLTLSGGQRQGHASSCGVIFPTWVGSDGGAILWGASAPSSVRVSSHIWACGSCVRIFVPVVCHFYEVCFAPPWVPGRSCLSRVTVSCALLYHTRVFKLVYTRIYKYLYFACLRQGVD